MWWTCGTHPFRLASIGQLGEGHAQLCYCLTDKLVEVSRRLCTLSAQCHGVWNSRGSVRERIGRMERSVGSIEAIGRLCLWHRCKLGIPEPNVN